MDLKEIKQIVDLMKRSGLTEFEIEEQDLKLRIARKTAETTTVIQAPQSHLAPAPAAAAAPAPAPEPVDPGILVKSPMVGTFYAAPSPDSPPYAKVGDTVTPDTVVCILEAMKVMNEIKAEVSGTITEVCASNGDSIEFGQPLFRLK